ncbi:MAG: hypothetical protein EBS38_05140 [Actinobacteria bacterium]|nr:hypothetical protein [Actinomycetota bacterium]
MPIFLILMLLLSGCSSSSPEHLLAQYLNDSSQAKLSTALGGNARLAQARALGLLTELRWSQSGMASYSGFKLLPDSQFEFCLDVSSVEFFDSAGDRVPLHRPDSEFLMIGTTSQIDGQRKITNLEQGAEC